jgi:hypothetical protein
MSQATIALVLFGWVFVWGICLAAGVGCWYFFKMCDAKKSLACLVIAIAAAIFIMLV